jgi:hypothetical protein
MVVQTTYSFNATVDKLWPLLFNSKMDDNQPCILLCGLPKPVECRLPDNQGGVGSKRECVSDRGTIQQRITEWEPGQKLSFELERTDLYFGPCVKSIEEQFELRNDKQGGCKITRTTTFKAKGLLAPFISLPMFIGLKAIHRYVFGNWRRLAA